MGRYPSVRQRPCIQCQTLAADALQVLLKALHEARAIQVEAALADGPPNRETMADFVHAGSLDDLLAELPERLTETGRRPLHWALVGGAVSVYHTGR